MSVYKGKLMRLKIGTKTIFHETSVKFNTSKDFNELASKDITGKEVTPGSYTWGLSCESLIADSVASAQEDLVSLLTAFQADTLLAVQFTSDVSGEVVISGNVYVETCDVDATNEEGVTGSFAFKGDGDFTVGAVV